MVDGLPMAVQMLTIYLVPCENRLFVCCSAMRSIEGGSPPPLQSIHPPARLSNEPRRRPIDWKALASSELPLGRTSLAPTPTAPFEW